MTEPAASERRLPCADEGLSDSEDSAEPEIEPLDAGPSWPESPGPPGSPDRPGNTEVALESQLRRALADLDNLRKRLDREVARQRAEERARVAAEWLPVVDNLDRALEHAGAGADAVFAGVRAVRDQAVAILARLGYPRYEDVGRPFDPTRDEAVGATPADAPPGTVVTALRPGYGTDQAVLRPAAVMVSKGAS
jgi:molecular chaperone GrpE